MPILVTDFDGTFTRRDFFDLILERHDPAAGHEAWRRFLAGDLNHVEGIGGVFASLRTNEAGAEALVDALDPAPGTAEAVRRLQDAGWEIVIASAGCAWYIERLVARLGLDGITIHACAGRFSPATGLVMQPDPAMPFYEPETAVDKPAVVRDALMRADDVAYAGDSNTDEAAAMLLPPERRFITGWLGRRFAAENIPHTPVSAWPEIADHLLD